MAPTDFMQAYARSGREGVEQTLAMIADDAVYWFSDGSSHVGKPTVERAIRRNMALIDDETYSISDVVWVAQSAEVAACPYRFDWSGSVRGAQASGFGRGTSVLARRGDSWVVVHEHLSKGTTSESGDAEI